MKHFDIFGTTNHFKFPQLKQPLELLKSGCTWVVKQVPLFVTIPISGVYLKEVNNKRRCMDGWVHGLYIQYYMIRFKKFCCLNVALTFCWPFTIFRCLYYSTTFKPIFLSRLLLWRALDVNFCYKFFMLISVYKIWGRPHKGGGVKSGRGEGVKGKCGRPQNLKIVKLKRIYWKKCSIVDDNLQITV